MHVYRFGPNMTDGKADMKNLLGGKGANLAEMALLKIPVPPGCTITTKVCTFFNDNNQSYPKMYNSSTYSLPIKQCPRSLPFLIIKDLPSRS